MLERFLTEVHKNNSNNSNSNNNNNNSNNNSNSNSNSNNNNNASSPIVNNQTDAPSKPLTFENKVDIQSAKRYAQQHGYTFAEALIATAKVGNTTQLKGLALIDGFDVNYTDKFKYTALHYAVLHNRTNMAQELLDLNAQIGLKGSDGLTAIDIAKTKSPYRNLAILKMLEFAELITSVNKVKDEDFNANSNNNKDFNANSNNNKDFNANSNNNKDLNANSNNNKDLNANSNNNAATTVRAQPLEIGIDSETLALKRIVNIFDNLNLDVTITPIQMQEPLIIQAINSHDNDTIHQLINNGCDLDVKDDEEYTPLQLAIKTQNPSIAKKILKTLEKKYATNLQGKIDHLNYMNKGVGALHLAVSCEKMEEIVTLLLHNGARINLTDEFGFTPLHLATNKGQLDNVRVLLFHGALANIHDINGDTALHIATQNNQLDIIKELLQSPTAQCQVNAFNNNGETPLMVAIVSGGNGLVEHFIHRNANVNLVCNQGNSALHYAAIRGFNDPLSALLGVSGLQIDNRNHFGNTPLGVAIHSNTLLNIRKLVLAGANINQGSYMGVTPLHIAVQKGKKEATKLLLDHGANPFSVDILGKTAKIYGCEDKEIVAMIEVAELLKLQPQYVVSNACVNETSQMTSDQTMHKNDNNSKRHKKNKYRK